MPHLGEQRAKPRRTRKAASERRAEILSAATREFAEHGYAGADVERIAARAGVGKGTVYRHFPRKQELFFATLDHGMLELHEAIEAATKDIEDPLDAIETAIRTYLTFFEEHPELAELQIHERAAFKNRPEATYFAHRRVRIVKWKRMLEELIAAGRVRPLDVDALTDAISDLLYGAVFTRLFTRRHTRLSDHAEAIIDVAFHGALTDTERKRRQPRSSNRDPQP